jgi:tartrate dehydratase beta subunit/fumarate hydratase class I family protein
MVRDWSKDEVEEDTSAYMLNPQKKRSEQIMHGGSTPSAKGAQKGQTPLVGPTPSMRTAEEETRPPPQDGGQGSSTQQLSQGQQRHHAFTTIHRSFDL